MSPFTKKIHWGTGTTNPLISQLAVVVDTEGDGRHGGKEAERNTDSGSCTGANVILV